MGAACLLATMDALRQRAQEEATKTFVLDAREVLDGLETIGRRHSRGRGRRSPGRGLEDALEDEDL